VSAAAPPVVALAIEVASPELMSGWLARGLMPNLKMLAERGAWSRLRSVTELSSGAVWPSFVTGRHPGRHGQYFTHMQLETGSYRIVKKYADDLEAPPFWRPLCKAGRRVALVDVPQTRPEVGVPGLHVVGWGGEYPAWPRSSEPPALMPEILRRFGPHPLAEQLRLAGRPEGRAAHEALVRDLVAGAEAKAALLEWLDAQGPFDLFIGVFAETHWAMHLLWHLVDPAHPDHDPELAARHGDIFERLLSIIDRSIGGFVARHQGARFVVFSLSGMGANHSGWHLLPEALRRLGMGGDALAARPKFGASTLGRVQRLFPAPVIEAAKRLVPPRLWDSWTRRLFFARSGWAGTRAFCLPNDQSGAIRINLKGREPDGLVAPGNEYAAVCHDIDEALRELVEPRTGRRIVADVIHCRKTFPGERADDLPDLVVVWDTSAPITCASSERLGTIAGVSPERRTGGHRNDGFVLAAGPGIAPGSGPPTIAIADLSASLLALSGVSASVVAALDLDGRSVFEVERGATAGS
jgi:predicted AlkP superfamily phosphohydrolase/phosphomutase